MGALHNVCMLRPIGWKPLHTYFSVLVLPSCPSLPRTRRRNEVPLLPLGPCRPSRGSTAGLPGVRLQALLSSYTCHTHPFCAPSPPLLPRSTQRDEAAAAALGLAGRADSATGGSGRRRSELASTFKSLGGAFKGMAKDVASVSKSQLKSLVGC